MEARCNPCNELSFTSKNLSVTITELYDMSDEQLKTTASELGIKKANPAKREELIYKILDQQAINYAATDTEDSTRRRGRKPKNQSQETLYKNTSEN